MTNYWERELDLKTYRMGITLILNNFVFDMCGINNVRTARRIPFFFVVLLLDKLISSVLFCFELSSHSLYVPF